MATSRTGTTTWKRVSRIAKRMAQAQGIERCMFCRCRLDYEVSLKPNSAEADHIIAHSRGGQDTLENCRVICRSCNQSRGNRMAPKGARKPPPKPIEPLVTSRQW